jgi:tetratricopeptide (TPR) repeat protein
MKCSCSLIQEVLAMSKSDSAVNNGEAPSPTTRQPRTATSFTKAVKLHMKKWCLDPLQPLLVIVRVTLIFLVALLAETLILMSIHWSFGKSLTHPLFAAKLLEGLQLLSALGTVIAYILYLMRSLFEEANQVVAERQPKDSQMGYTRMKRGVLKTLQDARHTWVSLAVGIPVTSLLYATLTTAGLAASASLLVAFSTLVGLLLLNLLVDTKASSLNLLQAARTLLRKLARSPEAEPLLQRALAIDEKRLGAEHPDTAQSLNNLAFLYTREGRYEQAEALYRGALASCVLVLGAEHPDTAQSLNNLALLYTREGKYEQAEPLYQHALTMYEKRLGAEHPDTAQSLNNLALLYAREGKYEQAEPLLQRALAIDEKRLGAEHPNTRTVQANYTRLLQKRKDEREQHN